MTKLYPILITILLTQNMAFSQSRSGQIAKKIFKISGIAVAGTFATASLTGIIASVAAGSGDGSQNGGSHSNETDSNSGKSDSGQSDSNSDSNSKRAFMEIENDYFEYLVDYQIAHNQGSLFSVEQIKQPYIKELIVQILSNEELIAAIDQDVEGGSLLEKINKVINQNFINIEN